MAWCQSGWTRKLIVRTLLLIHTEHRVLLQHPGLQNTSCRLRDCFEPVSVADSLERRSRLYLPFLLLFTLTGPTPHAPPRLGCLGGLGKVAGLREDYQRKEACKRDGYPGRCPVQGRSTSCKTCPQHCLFLFLEFGKLIHASRLLNLLLLLSGMFLP